MGGESLAEELVKRLQQVDRAEPPWTAFDKNLVEKVAADYHMSKRLIESIEDKGYNWLRELFEDISTTASASVPVPDEVIAYHRVAKTMWALAHAGRVVLVGWAGVFVTAGLSNGVHVRLVAPMEVRVHRIQKERGLSEREAHREIEELDQRHKAFYDRFWPGRTLAPETFTATYNTGYLNEGRIADSIISLVNKAPAPAARQTVAAGV